MSIQFYKKDIAKQKIFDMISHIDFDYLIIETENTTNHVQRIRDKKSLSNYYWLINKNADFHVSELDSIPHTFVQAESLVNELCAWVDNKRERIKKISAFLVITQFEDFPK